MKLSNKYIAGFVDGEGCISIFLHQKKGLARPVQVPTIKVTNKRYGLLFAIRRFYKGRGHVGPNRRSRTAPWNWTVKGQAAAFVLRKLLPFLNLKAPQARIVLRLCKLQKKWRGSGQHSISKKDYAYRYKLLKKCRFLNRKGGDATP